MLSKDRVQQLLQQVREQAKVIGTNVDGYQPKVARAGRDVLAFVFYPTNLGKPPILVALKHTEPSVEIYPPYEGHDYCLNKMLWGMGADRHCFQNDLEKTCAKN